LVYENLFNRKVLEFNDYDHKIILLFIDAMEIDVSEGSGGHAVSVVGVGYVVDGLDIMKVFLPS